MDCKCLFGLHVSMLPTALKATRGIESVMELTKQSTEARLQADFRTVQAERTRLTSLIENLNGVSTENDRSRGEERKRLETRVEELQRERWVFLLLFHSLLSPCCMAVVHKLKIQHRAPVAAQHRYRGPNRRLCQAHRGRGRPHLGHCRFERKDHGARSRDCKSQDGGSIVEETTQYVEGDRDPCSSRADNRGAHCVGEQGGRDDSAAQAGGRGKEGEGGA